MIKVSLSVVIAGELAIGPSKTYADADDRVFTT